MPNFQVRYMTLPPPELRGNSRAHWRTKARAAAREREEGYASARDRYVGYKGKPIENGELRIAIHHWRPFDLDNMHVGLKPFIDGLVDGGVFKDDHAGVIGRIVIQGHRCRKGDSKCVIDAIDLDTGQ